MIKITFENNGLTYIHPRAFDRFRLKTLKIIHKPKLSTEIVKKVLENSHKKRFGYIHLSYNNWTRLPSHIYQSFNKTKLKFLHLEGNKFSSISCYLFNPLQHIKFLFLGENELQNINILGIPERLMKLDLHNNLIYKIPNWCKIKKNKTSAVPNFLYLQLSGNIVADIGKTSFDCLPGLQILKLNDARLGKIKSNIFPPCHDYKSCIFQE